MRMSAAVLVVDLSVLVTAEVQQKMRAIRSGIALTAIANRPRSPKEALLADWTVVVLVQG